MHPSMEKEEESLVIDWHDFVVVADDEDYGLFPPMEEQEIKELIGMDVQGLEYAQSVVRAAMRIARVLTSAYKMSQQTNISQDDEIGKNIVHLAQIRPDMFGGTKDQVLNVVKAEVEKKQVFWDEEVQYVQAVVRAAMGIARGGLIPVKQKEMKLVRTTYEALAWARPDIFGTTKEEVLNALEEKVFWHGRAGNVEDQIDGVNDGMNLSGPHPVPLVKPLPPPPLGLH